MIHDYLDKIIKISFLILIYPYLPPLKYLFLVILAYFVIQKIYNYLKYSKQVKPWNGQRIIPPIDEWAANPPEIENRQFIKCYNPATLEPLCKDIPAMSANEVFERVKAARKVQSDWAKTSFDERRRVLYHLLDMIIKYKFELVKASCKDTGKTIFESYLGEILLSCERLRFTIQKGEEYLKTENRDVPLAFILKTAQVQYFPLGVIGIIVPWNYPFFNLFGPIVCALFTGNSVVIKVSEHASYSLVHVYANLIQNTLIQCGHSPDLVQFIVGFGEAGNALVKSGVNHLLFIGSPTIGKLVMKAAAENLTPVTLELGGKDPMIICDDVDLNYVEDYAIRSIFINQGQNCVAAERFYVHEKIYDQFVKSVTEKVKKLRVGPTLCEKYPKEEDMFDCGAMTMPNEHVKIEKMIQDAVEKGAKIECGGSKVQSLKGQFFQPTVISNVTHDMMIANEEVFGPVMVIIKWSTEEEVIKYCNQTAYGLGSYVFSKNYERAHRIANQIEAGVSMINDYGLFFLIQTLPFGGVKNSGFGKFNGPEGFRAFSRQKAFVTDRVRFQFAVPDFVKYPTRAHAHLILENAIDILYSTSWMDKLKALFNIIPLALKK